ncbi:MAG: hypothetical protein ACIAQU_12085, partial [Phycisphaerales bacterium JB064]
MAALSSGNRQRSRFFLSGLALITVLVFLIGGYLVLSRARADLRADIYRDRLRDVASDYTALAERFNTAVAQSAVTELVVEDGSMSVRVRS